MTVKRVAIALAFPLLAAWNYGRELGSVPDAGQMIWLCVIVFLVSGGIYLGGPVAKRIEYWSPAHMLLLAAALLLFVLAFPFFIRDSVSDSLNHPWAWPLMFFAWCIPVIHISCRRMGVKRK